MTDEIKPEDVRLPEPADHRYKFRDMRGREVWESGVPYGCTILETQALFTADQVRAAVLEERERIERSAVVQFRYGADDLDGVGFGEHPVGRPRYWWRSILRAVIRGHSITEPAQPKE